MVQELQQQIAALTAQRDADKGAELITAALAAAGKLLPAQKNGQRVVLKQPNGLAFLSGFIEQAQPIAALAGNTQTQAAGAGDAHKVAALTAEQKAAAKMLGMSEADFAQTLNGDKAA